MRKDMWYKYVKKVYLCCKKTEIYLEYNSKYFLIVGLNGGEIVSISISERLKNFSSSNSSFCAFNSP